MGPETSYKNSGPPQSCAVKEKELLSESSSLFQPGSGAHRPRQHMRIPNWDGLHCFWGPGQNEDVWPLVQKQ